MALDSVPEIVTAEPGDYDVRVLSVRADQFPREGSEIKATRLNVQTAIVGDEYELTDDIYGTVWWPHPEDTTKKQMKAQNILRDVVSCFGGDLDGKFDEEIIGKIGRVTVGHNTFQGKTSAIIKDWKVPTNKGSDPGID
jgi:hypothetical protein